MTADKTLNLWMASDTTERDALGTLDGLALGDFCLVDGANLYVATAVLVSSSTWRAVAGLATTAPYGLGGKNLADSRPRSLYIMSSVTFRAVLDAAPSSVTITQTANFNWPTMPFVILATATGFVFAGNSASIAANTNAWTRGTYTVVY